MRQCVITSDRNVYFSKTRRVTGFAICYKPREGMDGVWPLAKAAKQAFVDNLEHWLNIRKLSAADLARVMKVNPSAISNWKKGRRLPGPEKFAELAEVLRIPVFCLFYDSTDPLTECDALVDIAKLVDVRDGTKFTRLEAALDEEADFLALRRLAQRIDKLKNAQPLLDATEKIRGKRQTKKKPPPPPPQSDRR